MLQNKEALQQAIDLQVTYFTEKVVSYLEQGLTVFASSSFQTHSIPMLHILSKIDNRIPIYFLNTGFHFPQTLTYRDEIATLLGMEVSSLTSPLAKIAQKDANGRLLFLSDPDRCCYLNKTLPMETVLAEGDIWITGVRRDQNANRKNFEFEAKGPFGTTRFHPMLDWNNQMIWHYIKTNGLPKHPLEDSGYASIGCLPCTQKLSFDDDGNFRGARWAGLKKTECGLHTDLIEK